jgi:hypothetical protein
VSILSAARNLCKTFLAQKMFDQIQLHFSDDKNHLISAMVLLANTYARNGDFSIASDIRMKLNQSGLKKIPGLSTTVINKQIVVSENRSNKSNDLGFSYSNFEHMIDLIHVPMKSMLNWIV